MSHIFIYITCKDQQEAKAISSKLIEDKLIACANIFAPHTSIYKWGGKVEQNDEAAMILKTKASLFDEIQSAVKALHSYDCPCVIALPIEKGSEAFLEWIDKNTL